jgi:hypothetical protein
VNKRMYYVGQSSLAQHEVGCLHAAIFTGWALSAAAGVDPFAYVMTRSGMLLVPAFLTCHQHMKQHGCFSATHPLRFLARVQLFFLGARI